MKDFKISHSAVAAHLSQNLNYSLKAVRRIPKARNSPEKKQERYDCVNWIQDNGVDFMKDCVFIDETGFRKKYLRSQGYAKRGIPCVVEVSNAPGINISVVGCISYQGSILLSRHAPKWQLLEHHEHIGTKRRRKDQSHGTTSTHFHDFIKDLLDVMQDLGMTEKYLVMDNCSIHKGDGTEELIAKSGHKLLFLPTYAPFLNPIEKVWAQIKREVHKTPLFSDDDLVERVKNAAPLVSPAHCRGYIRNSLTFFQPCLDMEDIYYDEQFRQVRINNTN